MRFGTWSESDIHLRPESNYIARRLFHALAGSGIALSTISVPDPAYKFLLIAGALLSLSLDTLRIHNAGLRRLYIRFLGALMKPAEPAALTGATWLLIAAFLCHVLYDRDLAMASLLFLAVGDPAAALTGRLASGPRIRDKSLVGSAVFVLAAALAWSILALLGFVGWSWVYAVGLLVAALTELTPLPCDDNLSVPLVAGGVMTLAATCGL